MKKDKATFSVRIYPSTHEVIRRMAFKQRVSMAEFINQVIKQA